MQHEPCFSGDPWNEMPRAHEAPGGIYATGIIGKIHKKKVINYENTLLNHFSS